MEATPDLQVYDLGHLGLVTGILDLIGSVAHHRWRDFPPLW